MAVKRAVPTPGDRAPREGDGGAEGADARRLSAVVAQLDEAAALWQDFLYAHRTIIDTMAKEMMRDHGLPLEWFDVLIHLADVPEGRLRQRTLRDRLLLSESGLSRMLLRMEQAGLITRSTAGEDKRGMEITLTAKGRRAVIAAAAAHIDRVQRLFTDKLTRTDINALARILPKLPANSEKSAKPSNGHRLRR